MKNHFLEISVQRLSHKKKIWRDTWKNTQKKNHFLAISVPRLSYKKYIWRHTWEHSGEKPFPFNQCPKAFSNGHYLKIHLRTHSGENQSSYWTWSWDHYNQFFVRFWHLLISFWHSTNYVLNHLAVLWYVRLSNKLFHA